MASGGDVLRMLCKDVPYTVYGDNFDSIIWYGRVPAITKEQFEAGFAQYDAWQAEQDADKAAAKAALLAKLGITADEAQLLLGGN